MVRVLTTGEALNRKVQLQVPGQSTPLLATVEEVSSGIAAASVLFVDSAYTGGSSDGSLSAPFTALSDAVTAAPADGQICVLRLADPTLSVSVGKNLSIFSFRVSFMRPYLQGLVFSEPAMHIQSFSIDNATVAVRGITLGSVSIDDATLIYQDGQISANVSETGEASLFLDNVAVTGTIAAANLQAKDCTFAGNITLSVDDAVSLLDSNFDGAVTVTFPAGGELVVDGVTNFSFNDSGSSLVNGTKVIVDDLTP